MDACVASVLINAVFFVRCQTDDCVLQILVAHCGVRLSLASELTLHGAPGAPLSAPASSLRVSDVTSVQVPEDMPIDLRAKLMVCLIHLKQAECVQALQTMLFR